MTITLLVIAFFVAVVDWIAVGFHIRPLEYLAKPLVMILVLVWLIVNGGLSFPLVWFSVGAALAMLGDIALMLPGNNLKLGMALFGLAYISYGTGFFTQASQFNLASLALLILVIGISIDAFRQVSTILKSTKVSGLANALLGYGIILLWLLATAAMSLANPTWATGPAILVSIGALMLYLSDFLLIWNGFVHPFTMGRIPNLVTYHLGQLLVAYGVVLHTLTG